MQHLEEDLQKEFILWLKFQYPDVSRCCYAVNHGVFLGNNKFAAIKRMNRQKLMGVRNGIADLFIMKKTITNNPLIWIEFKHGKNKQSVDQRIFEQVANESNLPYYLCYNLEQAMQIIKENYDKF